MVWQEVDQAIKDWYCKSDWDRIWVTPGNVQDMIDASLGTLKHVNMIGLKRRVGKVLKEMGYTKTGRTPPRWEKLPEPIVGVNCRCTIPPIKETPQWVLDTYLSLLQAQTVIEKEYPGIEKEVGK